MNIRENYMKRADAFMGGEEQDEIQTDAMLKQHMFKLVMENGAPDVLASLIEVLSESENEHDIGIAEILHKVLGPQPE